MLSLVLLIVIDQHKQFIKVVFISMNFINSIITSRTNEWMYNITRVNFKVFYCIVMCS